jgi:hypothetical protein
MARKRRSPPGGSRDPLPRSGPTRFVFVDLDIALQYGREWREISRRYPALDDAPEGMTLVEHWQNLESLRRSAREQLRRAMRVVAEQPGCSGLYPIPV